MLCFLSYACTKGLFWINQIRTNNLHKVCNEIQTHQVQSSLVVLEGPITRVQELFVLKTILIYGSHIEPSMVWPIKTISRCNEPTCQIWLRNDWEHLEGQNSLKWKEESWPFNSDVYCFNLCLTFPIYYFPIP